MNNMKTSAVIGTLAVIVIFTFALSFISSAQLMPHVIFGSITDTDGNVLASIDVDITNQRTGDSLSVVANNNGQYQADLSAMPGGYQIGDTIKVEAESDELSGSSEIAVSAGPNDSCNLVLEEDPGTPAPAFGSLILLITSMAIFIGYVNYRRK